MSIVRAAVVLSCLSTSLLGVATALGAESFAVDVSTQVNGNCKFSSAGPYALSFTLDPLSAGDVVAATSAISFWCTKGVNFSIKDDGGQLGDYRMAGPRSETIAYSLSYEPSSSVGGGHNQPITLTVSGKVGYAAFGDKPAGVYTDRVAITIDP